MVKKIEFEESKRLMQGVLNNLFTEFSSLQSCRVSISILDPIMINAYGSKVSLSKVTSISLIEPRLLRVQVWDQDLLKSVDEAIRSSKLFLNPKLEGVNTICVPIPKPSQDRRREISKAVSHYAEKARISIRGIRREGISTLRKLDKEHNIGSDQCRKMTDKIQSLSDIFIKQIDKALAEKEVEIMEE